MYLTGSISANDQISRTDNRLVTQNATYFAVHMKRNNFVMRLYAITWNTGNIHIPWISLTSPTRLLHLSKNTSDPLKLCACSIIANISWILCCNSIRRCVCFDLILDVRKERWTSFYLLRSWYSYRRIVDPQNCEAWFKRK